MQSTPVVLRPAQLELQQTAHDQDLIEVPKRARQVREAEAAASQLHNQVPKVK
jgi:hypothetical protein